ncbi:MAG: aminotransferase class I/II-fold pyridoxal phosphate-dependent enzyme [Acidobacteria bacterium]|nr:aminotransferase class I/II-fold pyridoxal phosphate-dependent enzyme [Acidobacteriota bacterium]
MSTSSQGITTITPARRTEYVAYAIRDIAVEAEKLRKEGIRVLPLNIGDPLKYDFKTPRHMIEAVYRSMMEQNNGYAPSIAMDDAEAALHREAKRKRIPNLRSLFVSIGASEGIELCLTALVNPGENVLMPYPGYPLYTAVMQKLEAEIRPYYLDEENGWQPDVADMEARIDAHTRAICLINPNNPTGALYRKEVLLDVIALARRHRLVLFSDEIYDRLVFDGLEHVSTASLADDVAFVTFGGLSKNYLVPGWRMGWTFISGPAELVADFDEAVHKFVRARLCASAPMQAAIVPALEGPQDHLPDVVARLTQRRDYTIERLNAIPGLSCVKPEGAFYAFPKMDVPIPDKEFVVRLLREQHVLVVHGSGFGQKPGTQHFRVVTLPDMATLESAYDKLEVFMRQFR